MYCLYLAGRCVVSSKPVLLLLLCCCFVSVSAYYVSSYTRSIVVVILRLHHAHLSLWQSDRQRTKGVHWNFFRCRLANNTRSPKTTTKLRKRKKMYKNISVCAFLICGTNGIQPQSTSLLRALYGHLYLHQFAATIVARASAEKSGPKDMSVAHKRRYTFECTRRNSGTQMITTSGRQCEAQLRWVDFVIWFLRHAPNFGFCSLFMHFDFSSVSSVFFFVGRKLYVADASGGPLDFYTRVA